MTVRSTSFFSPLRGEVSAQRTERVGHAGGGVTHPFRLTLRASHLPPQGEGEKFSNFFVIPAKPQA